MGGPAGAARIFSSWAADWAAHGAEDQAAKLRGRAERCRALDPGRLRAIPNR